MRLNQSSHHFSLISTLLIFLSQSTFAQLTVTSKPIDAQLNSNGISEYLARPSSCKLADYFVCGDSAGSANSKQAESSFDAQFRLQTKISILI